MKQFFATLVKKLGRRTLLFVAVGAAAAASVGGISYALTANTQSAPTASASIPAAASSGTSASPTVKVRKGRVARALRRAVHVELVIPAAGGGFRTVELDRGTVSALSGTSITITPADGDGPLTDAITSATRQPKVPLSVGQPVLLASSDGNAVIIRHARSALSSSSTATGTTAS